MDQPIFGGGSNVTLLHPAVLIAMILAIVLILVLPRKYAVIPFLLLTFLGAVGQQIYVGGVHLFVLRILIFAAFLRFVVSALSRQKPLVGGWNSVDTVFTIWAVSRALANSCRASCSQAFTFTPSKLSGEIANDFCKVSSALA